MELASNHFTAACQGGVEESGLCNPHVVVASLIGEATESVQVKYIFSHLIHHCVMVVTIVLHNIGLWMLVHTHTHTHKFYYITELDGHHRC